MRGVYMSTRQSLKIMNKSELQAAIKKISTDILKKNKEFDNLVIIGIQTRGVPLAKRIAAEIKKKKRINIPFGILDITLYRDDVSCFNKEQPTVRDTSIPINLVNKNIILIDDVLYTGRTIRAALNELIDFGRQQKIQLAVLIDRGSRELPIHADYVGKNIRIAGNKKVKVQLKEIDGKEEVIVVG
ncbi:bifunctional pyr operon transcriptional regulator/uracil phosphoribosyltransferase PyrR [Candidatus Poribacteria bacterium]|nr:bifunctional pyr operon transcriptional regulator/uracil phosphoribosyltransferase PyrR [Candidatus Poribacteria bacterium]